MFLSKIFFNKYFKDIKPSYLLIEVFLIFIGISAANYFQGIKTNSNNKNFVKENLELFSNELSKNIKVNNHYKKVHIKLNQEISELSNRLFNSQDTNNLFNNQKRLIALIDNISISDYKQGVENIIQKDINLLKSQKMINTIESVLLSFDQTNRTLRIYNTEIDKLRELIFKNFEFDFNNNKILSIKDIESLKNDLHFKNQFLYVCYLRDTYVLDLENFNIELQNIQKEVNEYVEEL